MKRNVFVFSSCILLLIPMFLLSDLSGSNANSALPVFAATVRLGQATQTKTAIYSSNDSVTFTVTVTTTSDVPTDGSATAKVDFIEVSNFGNVAYTVSPGAPGQRR